MKTPNPYLVPTSLILLAALIMPLVAEAEWTHFGACMPGNQFDAQLTPEGNLAIFGQELIVLAPDGSQLLKDETFIDPRQAQLDMSPAVSVDPEGGIHAIRRLGGGWDSGHTIEYNYRPTGGQWGTPLLVSEPKKRNYCVAIVGIKEGLAYAAVSEVFGAEITGRVHFFTIRDGVVSKEGTFIGIWRADNIIEMRRAGPRLYLATGLSNRQGSATLMSAPLTLSGSGLFNELRESAVTYKPGMSRRGFPRLFAHQDGSVDFVMGAHTELFWARSSPEGSLTQNALESVFNSLGTWHLSIGMGAGASTSDGSKVLVAGLHAKIGVFGDGSLTARFSEDGGMSFGEEMIVSSDALGGEGRIRQTVLVDGNTFYVVYTARNESAPMGGVFVSKFDTDNTQTWRGYPVDAQGWADTGSWIGPANVHHDPWIWSGRLQNWLFIPDSNDWAFRPR